MKKIILSLLVVFIFVGAMVVGCKPPRGGTTPESTPTPTYTPASWLIDNMDYLADGTPGADNANAIPLTEGGPGYWYTYDDILDVLKPPEGDGNTDNASYVWPMSANRWTIVLGQPTPEPTFVMSEPGYGDSGYCARITGYVTTAFKYGFVGMGVNFLGVNADKSKKPVDISGMTGIRFQAKGDGLTYRIKLPSQHPGFVRGESDNHYGREFTPPLGSWTQVDVLMTAFTQEPYWGTSVNRVDALTMIDSIQFQTVKQPHASIDLYVDDIEIYK